LWSLGISLFELYYGFLPYSPKATSNNMLKYIYGDRKWTFRKTKDPNVELKYNTNDPKNPIQTITPKKPKDIFKINKNNKNTYFIN
jgi:hypothetical protein